MGKTTTKNKQLAGNATSTLKETKGEKGRQDYYYYYYHFYNDKKQTHF